MYSFSGVIRCSNSIAWSDRGTRKGSGFLSFLRSGGMVHTLAPKSISAHLASLNSACRVAVSAPKIKALWPGLLSCMLALIWPASASTVNAF